MGVAGLWDLLEPFRTQVPYDVAGRGKRIRIDMSIWLYELCGTNQPYQQDHNQLSGVLGPLESRVRLLKKAGWDLIPVFDGFLRFPGKNTENKTREQRKAAALAQLQQDNKDGVATSKTTLAAACTVTEELVRGVMDMLRRLGISFEWNVYQADHQLAHDFRSGSSDITVTRDGDLAVMGCGQIIVFPRGFSWGHSRQGTPPPVVNVYDFTKLPDSIKEVATVLLETKSQPAKRRRKLQEGVSRRADSFQQLLKTKGRLILVLYACAAGCDYFKLSGVGPLTAVDALITMWNAGMPMTTSSLANHLYTARKTTARKTELSIRDLTAQFKMVVYCFEHGVCFVHSRRNFAPLSEDERAWDTAPTINTPDVKNALCIGNDLKLSDNTAQQCMLGVLRPDWVQQDEEKGLPIDHRPWCTEDIRVIWKRGQAVPVTLQDWMVDGAILRGKSFSPTSSKSHPMASTSEIQSALIRAGIPSVDSCDRDELVRMAMEARVVVPVEVKVHTVDILKRFLQTRVGYDQCVSKMNKQSLVNAVTQCIAAEEKEGMKVIRDPDGGGLLAALRRHAMPVPAAQDTKWLAPGTGQKAEKGGGLKWRGLIGTNARELARAEGWQTDLQVICRDAPVLEYGTMVEYMCTTIGKVSEPEQALRLK